MVRCGVRAGAFFVLALGLAAPAFAQAVLPVPLFVIDARGFTVGLGGDATTAQDLGVEINQLPGRGFGGAATVNAYPLRRRSFAVGIFGEGLVGRGHRTSTQQNGAVLSSIERRVKSFAAGFSLNFGHRNGFSYLSGGMGPFQFENYHTDVGPSPTPGREITLNYGGGARWFNTPHIAFCFDVRFYETKPVNPTPTSPGRDRRRLLFLSAGISLR
jgi:hypothetical protein